MKTQNTLVIASIRAVTGVLITGLAATAAVAVHGVTLPTVTRAEISTTVDTVQNTQRTLVCPGSFGQLGADPADPSAVTATGDPARTLSGSAATASSALTGSGSDTELPRALSAPIVEPFAAAQIQTVRSDTLRGVVASSCTEPVNEQWLVGGASTTGATTTLQLSNPGTVAATVQLRLYDEHGAIDASQTASVLVPAGAQQSIPLNGYAPDREQLAVHLLSAGAPVTAHLDVGEVTGLEPFGVATVTRQLEPQQQLVFAGISNTSDHHHGAGDTHEDADLFSVRVRVLAPNGATGTARVSALRADGSALSLGELSFFGTEIAELQLVHWPEDAQALQITADAPVVAAVLSSAHQEHDHDYEWFAPAPELAANAQLAVPVVAGGTLVLANTGTSSATVELTSGATATPGGSRTSSKPRTITLDPGTAAQVPAAGNILLTSTQPIHAGVRYLKEANLAAYPVQASDVRDGTLRVYTR